jgi:DNA-binding beta-propeller fold protein YncE
VRFASLLTALGVLLVCATGAAAATPGGAGLDVSVVACVTGNTHVVGRQGCATAPGAGHEGSQSTGLDEVVGLVAGGGSLYAVGSRNSAVSQLGAGRRSLSFLACLTGDNFVDECAQVPGATSNAPEAPISQPTAAALSPDGRFLYVVSGDFHASVVARFGRDPLSGTLTYLDCLTGDEAAGPAGPGGCALIPTASREGYGSGLYEPSGIGIAADGRRLYVTAAGDGSLAAFDRDPATGALSFASCVSSNAKARGCTRVSRGGGRTIFEGLRSPLISADGKYLYAVADRADTAATFALLGSGAPRFVNCITPRDDGAPCRRGKEPRGPVAALLNPTGIATSPDNRFLYVSSPYGRIVTLKRNPGSGEIKADSCLSSERSDRGRCTLLPATPERSKGTHHASLLTGVRTLLLRGRSTAFAPVRTIDGIVRLRRDPRTGALAYRDCASAQRILSGPRAPCARLRGATNKGSDSGFYKLTALLPAPGGLLYAAAAGDATVLLLQP